MLSITTSTKTPLLNFFSPPLTTKEFAMKLSNERIIKAQLTGCRSTTKDVVVVPVSQIIQVLGLEKVQQENLFNWVVGADATTTQKQIVGSVIPEGANFEEFGLGEVKREHLLRLLEEHVAGKKTPATPPPDEFVQTVFEEFKKVLEDTPAPTPASFPEPTSNPVADPTSDPEPTSDPDPDPIAEVDTGDSF